MEAKLLNIKRKVGGVVTNFPSDDNAAVVGTYVLEKKRMGGAPTITATLHYPTPLDKEWTYDEYIEFNGDEYYITAKPSSSKDSEKLLYKHDLIFVSRRELLDNTLFFDVVSDDAQNKDEYRSNQTKFTFGGTIHEFVARINYSMSYCGLYNPNAASTEDPGFYIVVDAGYGTDEVKEISLEDQFLTNVLQLINTEFELDYYWVGKVCHVGKVQYDLTKQPLEYGRYRELLSITKENSNAKLVDMITGVGSSDNIPYYYPNQDEFGLAVFNTKNIEKDKVEVSLSELQANSGISANYTGTYVLVERNNGIVGYLPAENLDFVNPDAGKQLSPAVSQKITYTCRIAIKATAGTRVRIYGMEAAHEDNGTGGNIIFTKENDIKISVYEPGSSRGNSVQNNNVYECITSGVYYFVFEDTIEFYAKSTSFYKESDYITRSYSGTIDINFKVNDTYFWNNGTINIDYGKSGIKVNTERPAARTFTFSFDEIEPQAGIPGVYEGKIPCYSYSEWYAEDDTNNATQVEITGRRWIAPSSNLMPSIYRNSLGVERFYRAINNTYKIPDSEEYYSFKNLYKNGNPHQGTVSYDDIKPTINGIRNSKGELFGEIEDVAFDVNDSDAKKGDGETFRHRFFYIKLHVFDGDYGFNLFKQALASDNAKINMIDCIGCPTCVFPIYSYWDKEENNLYNVVNTDGNGNLIPTGRKDSEDGYLGDYILSDEDAKSDNKNQNSQEKAIWVAVQKETSTLGIVMPNAAGNFKPKKGDKFVITGIKMPETYVYAAEKRLDDALVKYMSENNDDQFNYSIKFSRVFLAENPDFANKLNENTKLAIQYAGNSEPIEVFVSNYTMRVEDSVLASIEAELVNSLEVTQSEIKQMIDSVKGETAKSLSSIYNGGNAFNASIADSMYLSKLKKDKAYGVIDFLKGVLVNSEYSINEFGDAILRSLQGKGFSVSELGDAILKTLRSADYDTAAQAGFGLMTRTDGKYKLSLTDLEVWGKAIFHELEIRKLSYSGGNYIFSPAGSTLMHVKEVRNQKGELLGWNCFFLADDGETATENLWKVGDLARCQSFNIKSGVYDNVANKYYWREVVSVSKENVRITDDDGNVLYDGKKFGRVSLSATIYDTGSTDIPAAGDTIVCLGNSTLTERQNAIIISTVGEEAPSFVQYCGIDDFTLQGKDVIVLSPKGNRLTGSFYSSAVSGELGSVLKQTMEGLTSEVSKRESEISIVRSEIKQYADAISLKVEQTAEKDRNLLPNSYFQIGSRRFGVCNRKVMLEKGKSYALTLWGRIDPFMTVTNSNGLSKLVANTHKMRAHIWTENTSGTWTYDMYAEIGADNETGYATVKFNDVPATGEYSFAIFPDVEINETNGEYMFYATCAQVEEIPNMQANGTAWSLGKKDPAIYGNLLPRLGGWTFGKNCILRPNEAEVEGHRLDVAGGANQSDTAGLDIIRLDGIQLTSGETYTLSFWARGKGKFHTYLFNGSVDVCSYAIRDDGAYGLLKDGSIEPQRTLTMDWTRFSVTFSIKTGGTANVIPVRLAKGGSVNICGVKLEPFGRLTDFTDQNVTVEELKATGIYITERKVNVIADNFQIKNRRNEETFAVDADGWVTMNHIAIGGMINKQGVAVNGLTAFNTLFDSYTDALKICWYTVPKFNNMYGIYYFTAPTGKNTDGKVPVRIHMPSAYVYQDGSSYYVSGDVYDENDQMDMNLLRSVRAMVGNTVMIYNDSSEDIQIEGKSCYFVDKFKPMNYASAKSATTALKAPSVGLVTPDTNVGDMSNALDKPLVNDDDGGVKPNQRYYGRRRDDLLITLKGGEHRFVCMTCVCEVNIYGWENIYWLVNYGQGLNTN